MIAKKIGVLTIIIVCTITVLPMIFLFAQAELNYSGGFDSSILGKLIQNLE